MMNLTAARRLEAYRYLERKTIPAHVVTNLTNALLLMQAEKDENEQRKGLEPSEAVSEGKAFEALIAGFAKQRQEASRIKNGKPPGASNLDAPSKGRTDAAVAATVGMG